MMTLYTFVWKDFQHYQIQLKLHQFTNYPSAIVWIYAMLWMSKWTCVASGAIFQSFPDDPTWKLAQTPRYILPLAMDKSIYNLIILSIPNDINLCNSKWANGLISNISFRSWLMSKVNQDTREVITQNILAKSNSRTTIVQNQICNWYLCKYWLDRLSWWLFWASCLVTTTIWKAMCHYFPCFVKRTDHVQTIAVLIEISILPFYVYIISILQHL